SSAYNYLWSNGETSEDISGLSAGLYNVTVSDNDGCTASGNYSVSQPSLLTIAIDTSNNVLCHGGSTGMINLLVSGGTSPFSYLWSNNYTTDQISLLPAGSYICTVTDSNACIDSITVIITEPDSMNITVTISNVSCNAGSDGSININILGGTSPYSYIWSNGQTIEDISNLSAGNYDITITDNNLCVLTASFVIIEPLQALAGIYSQVNVACQGDSTGSIDLTITGGTLPYNYLWSNGQTVEDINNLPTGIYNFTITDANACSYSDMVNISEPEFPLSLQIDTLNVDCYNDSTGSITLNVSGGTTPYQYLWSDGQTVSMISGIPVGNYFVTITDTNLCTIVDSITITGPDSALSSSLQIVNIDCYGDSTGAINLSVYGGTTPYSYLWSNGETSQDISNIPAGNYSITITDRNLCLLIIDTIVSESLEIILSLNSTDVLCFGDSTGSIDLTVSGGSSPYSYLWTSGQTTEDISNLPANFYGVTVTDIFGCSSEIPIFIFQPSNPISYTIATTDLNCYNDFTGAIDLSVFGGTTPYQFNWSNISSSEDLLNIAAGNYFITITDTNNCFEIDSVFISEPNELTITETIVDVLCYNDSTGSISLTVGGGTNPYSYLWSNSVTSQDNNQLPYGQYFVTITDQHTCTLINSFNIIQPLSALSLELDSVDVLCFGDTTGCTNVSAYGGTSAYSYLWSNGVTLTNICNLNAGWYSVTVEDFNQCNIIDSIIVNQPQFPISSTITTVNVNCFGDTTGSIDLSVFGGTSAYSFVWSESSTTEDIDSLLAGIYYVTITDANMCNLVSNVNITEPISGLNLELDSTDVDCYGNFTGAIDLTISGATPGYSYIWSTGSTNQDINNLQANSYVVIVTDANNCIEIDSIIVVEPTELTIDDSIVHIGCYGDTSGSINLQIYGGNPGYSIEWSNSLTTNQIVNLSNGTYLVTITDTKFCTLTDSFIVNQPLSELLATTDTAIDVLCFGDSTGSINIFPLGGTSPYFYNWSNTETTQNISNLNVGNYQLTITDNNGCVFNYNDTINQPDSIEIIINNITNVFCFGDSTGSIEISVSGGIAGYTYIWNNGATTEDINDLINNTYSVIVSDQNDCLMYDTFIVTQTMDIIIISLDDIIDVDCYNQFTGSIDISVTGGTPAYSYLWSNNSSSQDLNGLGFGEFILTVTDAFDCEMLDTFYIQQPESAVSLTIDNIEDVKCYSENTGFIDIQCQGGTPGYSYNWSNSSSNEDISNLYAGQYFLTVLDNNNCTLIDTFTISQPYALMMEASVSSYSGYGVKCFNDSNGMIEINTFNGTSPYSFEWSNGSTNEDIYNLFEGNYSITISDFYNCEIDTTIKITEPNPIDVVYSTQESYCPDSHDGLISINIAGGIEPYSYLWSNNKTTEEISNLYAGNYSIVVSDSNQCTYYEEFDLQNLYDACIFIPNVITPNGDGANDKWEIRGSHLYPNIEVELYNRWGQLIWKSEKGYNNKWNGTSDGQPVPINAYWYVVKLGGNIEPIVGHVSVLR
ncbi:MAG: T9SS type B sorting domain-containing protein, partial [Bacteroidetes bacterium]|nr:T9SS type B sorting domain-containing protein [Bacteroidota bacterium]MBT7142972.1 T9SS type B sorting domain-containing protein [Bacteroidota bacterium]